MINLLCEIGCEDLPAHEVNLALSYMNMKIPMLLYNNKINYQSIILEGTHRRLLLYVKKLSYSGLYYKTCMLDDMNKNNSHRIYNYKFNNNLGDDIKLCNKTKYNVKIEDILSNILCCMLKEIPFVKKMKWQSNNIFFSRPIRWILCCLGERILNIPYAGIISNSYTCVHRMLGNKRMKIASISNYFNILRNNYVILSAMERKNIILHYMKKESKLVSGVVKLKLSLLNNIINMVEYPWILLCSFKKEYLQIPKKILCAIIEENQKCFVLLDSNDILLNYFIVILDIKPKLKNNIMYGYSNALQSKLVDFCFYYKRDLKIGLYSFLSKLKNIIFMNRLGSMHDKVLRMQRIAYYICSNIYYLSFLNNIIKYIIQLCKFDLASNVVMQFPYLKGMVGKIYVIKYNKDIKFANIIEEHYFPRFSNDQVSKLQEANLISFIDKLDSLIAILSVGKNVTSDSDPFYLRRLAIAINKTLIHSGIIMPIKKILVKHINLYDDVLIDINKNVLLLNVYNLIIGKFKYIIYKYITKYNTRNISIIFNNDFMLDSSNLVDIWVRLEVLLIIIEKKYNLFVDLKIIFKRLNNLLSLLSSKYDIRFNKFFLVANEEIELYQKIEYIEKLFKMKYSISKSELLKQYYMIVMEIIYLKPYINVFFKNIMVLSQNDNKRNNRIFLILKIKKFIMFFKSFLMLSVKS